MTIEDLIAYTKHLRREGRASTKYCEAVMALAIAEIERQTFCACGNGRTTWVLRRGDETTVYCNRCGKPVKAQ